MGTKEQHEKIEELQKQGFKWNKSKSISACGVVLEKDNDIYFFGLNGEILHNPQGNTIKT